MDTIVSKKITGENEVTRGLLVCGVVAGPLFIGASLIQALLRPGFDLSRHPISLLLLGDLGWVQFINFVVTGLLALAYAFGMRRFLHPGRGGTWGPLLVGIYGVGFITAGVFPPDPEFGFPAGAPGGVPGVASGHANIQSLAFLALMLSVIAASFIFARRFAGLHERGWAAYCVATGVAVPALFILGAALTPGGKGGLPLLGVALFTSAWLAVVAARLLTEANHSRQSRL